MVRWKLNLALIAALATSAFGEVISGPDNAGPGMPPPGGQIIVQQGAILIQGNVQFQGNIQIQGGLVIIGGAAPSVPDLPFSPDQLPIVSSGFANDLDIAGPITSLVEALRSSSYAAREDASEALLRLPPRRLNEIVEALAHTTDPESVERLTQAAAHLYLKPRTLLRPPGRFMGYWNRPPAVAMLGLKFRMDAVKLDPAHEAATMTAIVTEIQPGFPTLQTLRNGDRIIAIGETGFPANLQPTDSEYFRRRVMSEAPGSQVPMTILRDGKIMELHVQLAGVAIPENSEVDRTLTTVIQLRAAGLDAFLRSLKTGDQSPVLISASSSRAYPVQTQTVIPLIPQNGDVFMPVQPDHIERN